jgi:hypothetical protein
MQYSELLYALFTRISSTSTEHMHQGSEYKGKREVPVQKRLGERAGIFSGLDVQNKAGIRYREFRP